MSTADTYSDDGSYGLGPADFGNFTGIVANTGRRWVAGADRNGVAESFYQTLTTPLTPGTTYEVTGFLHRAVRSDLNNPGGYRIELQSANGALVFDAGLLGNTGTVAEGWQRRSLAFTAPQNAASLERFVFVPVSATAGAATYAGLDDVTLTATPVPEPATLAGLVLGAAAVLRRRARRIG